MANQMESRQVIGPSWMADQWFSFQATLPEGFSSFEGTERLRQARAMLRAALAERFGLTSHSETRELPGFTMVTGKGGIRAQVAQPDQRTGTLDEETLRKQATAPGKRHSFEMTGTTMVLLADRLSWFLKMPVTDNTGLPGKYDVFVDLPKQEDSRGDDRTANMVRALQEQCGLVLRSAKVPVPVVVVDHAERTSTEN